MSEPQSPQDLIYGTSRRPAAPLSPSHKPLVARIYSALDAYVTTHGTGRVWRNMEVILDRREGIALLPDLVFVVEGRESIVDDRVWGPPDMVLEMTTPLTHSGKLEERVSWFSVHGVREYWLVQPEQREIAVLELAHGGVRRRLLFNDKTPIQTPLFADFDRTLGELL